MTDGYESRSYGEHPVGFGRKPGIVVVDFQLAFTDPKYALGGAPLIERAVRNTSRLLDVARRSRIPVANCYMAYQSKAHMMMHWKVGFTREHLLVEHPCTALDPRTHDPSYDLIVCKPGASIFFQTPVVSYFVSHGVDTVIVTGCVTSGCVRASIIDSFQYGFRTIVPQDCVGDQDERPHQDNLRDVGRRYCDITDVQAVCNEIEDYRNRNQ
ncbi:MAG: isochorismatase family protein [Hyphomicrobiaceae bacterium]